MEEANQPIVDLIKGPPSLDNPDYILGKSEDVYVKETVTYIVAGIILRGTPPDLEVVLVQEAKASCYGKWYLPAGRLEKNETLIDGCIREVKEESFLDVGVDSLLTVQVQGGGWYRFIFACTITGGQLKTTEQADSESLQASWFSIDDVINKKIPIRANDIVGVLSDVRKHYAGSSASMVFLPISTGVYGMFTRLLIVHFKNNTDKSVLVAVRRNGSGFTLPLIEYALNTFVPVAISKLYRELFVEGASDLLPPNRIVCVQNLPMPPREHDGICLTVMCLVKANRKPCFNRPDEYAWIKQDEASKHVLEKFLTEAPIFKMD